MGFGIQDVRFRVPFFNSLRSKKLVGFSVLEDLRALGCSKGFRMVWVFTMCIYMGRFEIRVRFLLPFIIYNYEQI